jgi:hypothetical protein
MPYAGTNMCTGESFTGTATVHTELNENLSASGTLQYHFNVRIDGMKSVTVLGKKYVVQDTLNHEFVFGGADEETYDMTAHFIRLGEDGSLVWGDDFYEYLRTHITSNAMGVVTAFDVRTNDAPCQ